MKPFSRDAYAEAISLYERALRLDPRSVEALSSLATMLAARVLDGMTDAAAADIARAEALLTQALAASPLDPRAHFAKGMVLRVQGRPEEAIPEFEAVLAADHNSAEALFQLGWCKLVAGSIDEVIPLAEQLIRLSPRDPHIANRYSRIGYVYLLQSRIGDAVLLARKGVQRQSANSGVSHASRFGLCP